MYFYLQNIWYARIIFHFTIYNHLLCWAKRKPKRNKTPLNVEPTVPVQFDLKFFTKNFTDNKPVERPKILDQKDPDPMLEKGLGSLLGMSIKDYK